MCGIAGIFNINGEPVSPVVLRKMTDAIAHRGPDSEGFYTDSFVGLGHRRLSIIDLSEAGHQPMMTRDRNFVISYNGEVYNHNELRSELESLGYAFHSKTDTEVVLNAYVEWGEKSVSKFNGMFAFAIWDKTRQELFLARDRYGIKPLYYTVRGNHFIFGSEIKAILQHPAYQTELDKEALVEYFTFQNYFTDRTLFKGIGLMPTGSFTKVQLGTMETAECTEYWDYHFEESEKVRDEREYLEELDRLFKQAVERQLMADVKVGTYLSGGMDSGSITAIAAKQMPYITSFTCGFDLTSASGLELNFDERPRAEYMSYLFKTEHYEQVLKSGDMERVLPDLCYHLEEPRVGQSYPNYYVSRLASKFVKVVLGGTGGDELFGGYPWRYYRAVRNKSFDEYIDKYYLFWQRLIPNSVIHQVFKPISKDIKDVWTANIFRDVFQHHKNNLKTPEDYINHSLYFEAKTFLHGLFVVEDKLSMAHGLESRVPFMDNDLVDFALKVPVKMKLGKLDEIKKIDENQIGEKIKVYFDKTRDGKLLLRKMMENYIPKEITDNIKQGFSAPDSSWFKGDSIDFVKENLLNKNEPIYTYLDYNIISGLLSEHLNGKKNWRLLIWSLLNFNQWCKQFIP